MNKSAAAKVTQVFFVLLALWTVVAIVVAFTSGRWIALTAIPAALVMLAAARAARLSQSAQLAWPVLLLPGACFVFIGFMQALGYGRMENEPAAEHLVIRGNVFRGRIAIAFGLIRAVGHRVSGERSSRRRNCGPDAVNLIQVRRYRVRFAHQAVTVARRLG